MILSYYPRIHQLATNSNLCKWGMKRSRKCGICLCKSQSTLHVLNGCQTSLKDGRFTWRHDSILNHLHRLLKHQTETYNNNNKPTNNGKYTIFADLPKCKYNAHTTIPETKVGARGIFSKDNTLRLKQLCEVTAMAMNKKRLRRLKFQIEKIAIKASHRIFKHRNNKNWESPSFLYEELYESMNL